MPLDEGDEAGFAGTEPRLDMVVEDAGTLLSAEMLETRKRLGERREVLVGRIELGEEQRIKTANELRSDKQALREVDMLLLKIARIEHPIPRPRE